MIGQPLMIFLTTNLAMDELHIIEELDKRFNFIAIRDEIKLLKRIITLLQLKHLEYLNCINFPVSRQAEEFAKHWEELVMTNEFKWSNKIPERF